MTIPSNIALALFATSALSQAEIIAGFTDGNTAVTPDQYPGAAGAGWTGAWATSGTVAPTASVINTTPVNSGGNYLGVSSSSTGDNAIGRRFSSGVGTSVDLTLPTTITFDVRIDTLTGWDATSDYITLHSNSGTTDYNTNASSTFVIRGYGASPGAGLNANEWLLHDGTVGSTFTGNLKSSGMPITPGTTYTFTVTNHPSTKKYSVTIFDGTTTVSASDYGWRSTATAGSNSIAVNHKVSAGTDQIAYSMDKVTIQANVVAQPDTVANFTDGNSGGQVDQFKGIAGLGWDAGWDFTIGATGTAPSATVMSTSPVNGSGNYLAVSTSYNGDTAIGREFDSIGSAGGYDITTTKIKTTLSLRVDSLSGWNTANDYLTVHATSNTDPLTQFNVSNKTTFFIRAFGDSPAAGKNASEWLLYNGASDGGAFNASNFINSGMPLVGGKTYTFTIISDPATLKYSGSISDGTNTVTWGNLGWRANVPADRIAINTKVSDLADTLGYSLDNVVIIQAPDLDYDDWSSSFGLIGGLAADDDNDGLSNGEEYAFGLIPNDGSSVNPITVPLNRTAGTLTFQCRDQALTDLTYSVWTSTDLSEWIKDETATITPGTADGNSVQQVAVTLTGTLLTNPKLFVQVRAE